MIHKRINIMNFNQYILAIVGAGEAALPIINKAKEMNIETLAFGRLDSIAKDQVNYFIEENNFDIEYMSSICKKYNVSGVIASSEITTEATAKLAHKLGLPGNSIENGFAGRNKYLMRCRVSAVDSIKQPHFELYTPNKDYHYPVIVKALDSCGKQGISLANNREELESSVRYAYNKSSDGNVLIEEYLIGGQEYSIECLSYNNKHIIVQYTEKESSGPPHFVEIAHHQPANLSDEMRDRISLAVSDILDVLGLTCGMAHLELKIIDDELYFIEVGARAGGGCIGDTLTIKSTDFDYFKAAIECSIGIFKPTIIRNIAYTGIYFQLKWNEHLKKLFEISKTASWCIKNTIKNDDFIDATSNIEKANSGYFIYCSDHKIGISECEDSYNVELLNEHENSYTLIKEFCKKIGRYDSDNFDEWYKKIIKTAYILAIKDKEVFAFSLLYNTDKTTDDCYICNVHVLDNYRGNGYSVMLLNKAIEICKQNNLKTIYLHVNENNKRAVSVYRKFGFITTGATDATEKLLEMKLQLE